ncbi:hypothetical protein EK0264_10920 [Epidermidibacterium keratini]|uniref:Uncharacterized protein n=1 Tax=Epidermidibacterium keratini TaxID=1891644 RepID=A0A7L4YNL7_9ACTN|nr:hypothetical protein [Epidermidibacterium keratini]QHC00750.1 hypothetical protein EK0264_10920 [Epidermidibacterium keratini]
MSGPAADDRRTREHEKAKDRAFTIAIVLGVALIVAGAVITLQGGLWILLGVLLFMIGGSFAFASIIGFYYRRSARRALAAHPWREVGVGVLVEPAGRKGRSLLEVRGHRNQITATGLDSDVLHKIKRVGRLEYAGDLDSGGMIFVRLPDAEEIYIATVR